MAVKKSSELVTGDVVTAYGMRVRIEEVKQAPAYGQEESLKREGLSHMVTWSVGTVLNVEEVIENCLVPLGFMGQRGDDYTWQIQGNDRATWNVED